VAIAAGDFNHDGHVDLACANGGTIPSVTIYLNDGTGVFTLAQTVPLVPSTLAPIDMGAGDTSGDGNIDLVVSTSTSRIVTLLGSPSGSFTQASVSGVGFPITHITVADFNADGRADVAYPIPSQNEVGVSNSRPDGTFQSEAGTAGGDYFVTFNVPNSVETDPDPVVQLQAQFDAWRTAKTGHPDAVQSHVSSVHLTNYDPSSATGMMNISLLDWQGQPITAPIASVNVTVVPGGSGVVAVGPVTNEGQGVYLVQLSDVDHTAGTDHLIITVDDSTRKVVLMPQTAVIVGRCAADFDGDGNIGNDADIAAFFACLAGNCCATCLTADFDNDGDIGTDADIEAFFRALVGPCNP
jgi:hypothetical protein